MLSSYAFFFLTMISVNLHNSFQYPASTRFQSKSRQKDLITGELMRETPVSDLNLRRAWGTVVNFCVALLLYYQETRR